MSNKPPQLNNKRGDKIIAIVGPTGSGKTEWAKILAQKFNGKIISADSRQIYQEMDIGTGKDTSFKQELMSIVSPDQRFTVWDYQKLANEKINQFLNLNFLPIIVGGTGLYIEAVLYNYIIPNLQKDSWRFRQNLEKLSDKALVLKLKKVDPKSAQKIDLKNRRRVIRALEVAMLTKKSFVELRQKGQPKYEFLILGIKTDRQTLYSKIDARIDRMLKDGLVEEVRGLLKKYRSDLPSLNTIGYKEIIDYLRGRFSLTEAIDKIKTNTHAYVRRQETWFRHDKNIKWVSNIAEAEKLVKKFLKS